MTNQYSMLILYNNIHTYSIASLDKVALIKLYYTHTLIDIRIE